MQDWGCGFVGGMQSGTVQVAKASARRKSDARRARAEECRRGAGAVPCRCQCQAEEPVPTIGTTTALDSWSQTDCRPGLYTRAHSCDPPRFPITTYQAARRDSFCRLRLLSVPLCLRLPVDPVRNPPDDGHDDDDDDDDSDTPQTTTRHPHSHTGFPRSVDPSSAALGEGCLFDERDHP